MGSCECDAAAAVAIAAAAAFKKFEQNLQRRGTSDTSFIFTFPEMQLI